MTAILDDEANLNYRAEMTSRACTAAFYTAVLFSLINAACDECAGRGGAEQTQCCDSNTEAPSCRVLAVDCGAPDATFSHACELSPSKTVELTPSGAASRERQFAIRTAVDTASMSLSVERLPTESNEYAQGLTVTILTSSLVEIASFIVDPADPESGLEREFGVRAGAVYYVSVRFPATATPQYHMSLGFSNEPFEVEPNDSGNTATHVPVGATVRGGPSGVSGTGTDVDFLEFVNDGTRRTLAFTLYRLTVSEEEKSPIELLVMDNLEKQIDRRLLGDEGSVAVQLGANAGARYLVRVQTQARTRAFGYVISSEFSNALHEIEPNDSLSTADVLPIGKEVVGAFSAHGEQIDDDLYRISVPPEATELRVRLLLAEQGMSNAFQLTALDALGSELQRAEAGLGEATLQLTVGPAPEMFLRVRSTEQLLDGGYSIFAEFPAR